MNQQEKIAIAKRKTFERLKEDLADFVQVGDYSFASLEDVEGEEWWVVVNLVAKKNYDIDEAIEDYEFKKESKEKKKASKS